MLRNRLAELLVERNLKISRVAVDMPNLSRNTITSTAQNNSKMIQLETINTLCQYLDIAPSDFFEYVPFDLDFVSTINDYHLNYQEDLVLKAINLKNIEFEGFLKKKVNSQTLGERTNTFELVIRQTHAPVEISYSYSGDAPKFSIINFDVLLLKEHPDQSFKTEFDSFMETWDQLTPGFKADFQQRIQKSVTHTLVSEIGNILHSRDKDEDDENISNANVAILNSRLQPHLSFTFSDALESTKNGEPTIDILSDDLPF